MDVKNRQDAAIEVEVHDKDKGGDQEDQELAKQHKDVSFLKGGSREQATHS